MTNNFRSAADNILKSPLFQLFSIFIIWRLLIYGIFILSNSKLGPGTTVGMLSYPIDYFPPLLGTFKWDSYFYLTIALEGYGNEPSFLFAFYPLFPILISIITSAGIDPLIAGALLNSAASFFTCYFLFLLAKDHFQDNRLALRVILIFIFFPFSYFLFGFYTEALFCSLVFSSFWFARKRKWLISCIILAFLTASRIPSLVVVLAVFIEYLYSINFSWKKIDKNIFYFALAPIGILSYMLYLYIEYDNPILFLHAYDYNFSYYKFEPNIFKTIFLQIKSIFFPQEYTRADNLTNNEIPFLFWLAFLIITIAGIKKVRWSYLAFCFGTLIFISLNSNFIAVNRYIIPLFPVYIIIIDIIKKYDEFVFNIYLTASAILMGFLTILFSLGYWTG